MRYIGSKENLLDFIETAVATQGITGGTFCDLFAGTTTVGRHFKRRGFRVISNDLMQYSFVFGKAYIENNAPPAFAGVGLPRRATTLFDLDTAPLEQALDYLNRLPPEPGFMFQNYCDVGTAGQEHQRMYFSAANAGKIDAIRRQIAEWHRDQAITDSEFYVLLASLLEAVPSVSNTTGTYAAFLKFWESRSQKPLTLTIPPLIGSNLDHRVYKANGNDLINLIECDVLYLDPPYNSRQYAPNYHILETVARWDAPTIYGKSGLRPYKEEKSEHCQKNTAIQAFQDVGCQPEYHASMQTSEPSPCHKSTRRKAYRSPGSRSSWRLCWRSPTAMRTWKSPRKNCTGGLRERNTSRITVEALTRTGRKIIPLTEPHFNFGGNGWFRQANSSVNRVASTAYQNLTFYPAPTNGSRC